MTFTLLEKQKDTDSFTLYSGLSARSRPRRSACQNTGWVRGSSPASSVT